ncbi:MAG TPA: hypothetical protein PK095_18280 [Myxococcota bacterium]|nr:hypothetical protein [Myxococcota bacterium]
MNPRLALTLVALLTGTPAWAQTPDPAPLPKTTLPLEVKSGKVDLPLSGLRVDLPAQGKGHTYKVSASFSLEQGFDARDVIDEAVDGKLVAGTWVLVGFFTAGTCKDVVGAAALDTPWESELTLHDIPFTVRGGVFTFDGELGKVPSAVLCAERPKLAPGTRKALLLYHFFLGTDLATPREELLAMLKKRPSVERSVKSWKLDTLGGGRPLEASNVRIRGDKQPGPLTLQLARLSLRPPDDGTFWTTRSAPDEGVDWIDRMVPALPEVSVEVVHSNESCAATLAMVTGKQMKGVPAARHLPSGWSAGPILDIDGDPEYTVCRDFKGGALLVGYFLEKSFKRDLGDLRPIHAILDALTASKL